MARRGLIGVIVAILAVVLALGAGAPAGARAVKKSPARCAKSARHKSKRTKGGAACKKLSKRARVRARHENPSAAKGGVGIGAATEVCESPGLHAPEADSTVEGEPVAQRKASTPQPEPVEPREPCEEAPPEGPTGTSIPAGPAPEVEEHAPKGAMGPGVREKLLAIADETIARDHSSVTSIEAVATTYGREGTALRGGAAGREPASLPTYVVEIRGQIEGVPISVPPGYNGPEIKIGWMFLEFEATTMNPLGEGYGSGAPPNLASLGTPVQLAPYFPPAPR